MDHIGVSVHLLMDMGCYQPGQLFIWRQDLLTVLEGREALDIPLTAQHSSPALVFFNDCWLHKCIKQPLLCFQYQDMLFGDAHQVKNI